MVKSNYYAVILIKIQVKQEHVEGKYMAEYYRSPVSLESPETK